MRRTDPVNYMPMNRMRALLPLLLCAFAELANGGITYAPASAKLPPVPREFRAAWVATVGNINWPSKPGLPVEQQKAELIQILNTAVSLKLNAIIFQVRPACDALYASGIEPWSEYLTGRMGQPPAPAYDPLAFAISEAHKRGLELHAWFNPFRARYFKAISPISPNHISRTHPELVRRYGQFLWLDPGDPKVHELSLGVILDVLRRYDVDGVHMDDYFYPYPEKDHAGNAMDFPDESSWRRYTASGGRLSREDWRRENVNKFIQQLYASVKREKRFVKVGVSPFGIWRPGFPAQIRGFDAYDRLFADSRKWLVEGWLDYFAPQLYWSIDAREQSFPVLHQWWTAQNPKERHIWPGLSVHGTDGKRTATELRNEILVARQQRGADGEILWGFNSLQTNRRQITDALKNAYGEAALVPECPWLERDAPAPPVLKVSEQGKSIRAVWNPQPGKAVWLWVLQAHRGTRWDIEILPAGQTSQNFSDAPDVIAVTAIDRCSNSSAPTILAKASPPLRAESKIR